jgi:hypothetical protein
MRFEQTFNYFPEAGDLIIFPSWMLHKVLL